MGFPYEQGTWEGVSGAIFMGFGSSAPGIYTALAIIAAVALLAVGQKIEADKYRNHK